jgi:flagellar FliJ protein
MSKALLLVYERLHDQEEKARNVYLAAKNAEANFERQLDALNQYRSIYSNELQERGNKGVVSTLAFEHYTSFINRLDKISAEQLDGLKKIRKETQDKYDKYKELEAKRKAIELLLEKQKNAKLKKQEIQEQKMSDDLNVNRFFQKTNKEI